MPTNNFKVGEMLNKRTPNSKTWINFDGSYTTEIHAGVVHYEDENSNLQNINTDLYDEADFDSVDFPVAKDGDSLFFEAREKAEVEKNKNRLNRDNFDFQGLKVPFEAKLPRNIKRGYSIGKGASKLTFIPQDSSPSKGYVEGNKITYQDAWNDTDLILEVLPDGIKETIILKSERAPFNFSFEVQGNLEGEMKIQPPWLQDAEGTKRDVVQGLDEQEGRILLNLVADVSNLVYPIEIDPTVTIQPNGDIGKDTYIEAGTVGASYPNDTTIKFGRDINSNFFRSLIEFDISNVPIGSVVSSAILDLQVYTGGAGESNPVVYKITQPWQESITWSTQPSYDSTIYGEIPATTISNGLFSFPITSLVKEWIENNIPNYGLMIEDKGISTLGSNRSAYSSDYSIAASRPKLVVTYNAPPTAPKVISPNGGETWNNSHLIEWLAADDGTDDNSTPQANLQYQIQLTIDGSVWKDIIPLTGQGVTSYEHDFATETETSLAKIRIRAFDGYSYGPWDESDGVFTIQHERAPTTPTTLAPNGVTVDRGSTQRLSWKHNDPNPNDPQSKFVLYWRLQGSSTWNEITQVTINEFYEFPPNVFPRGTIEWRVRTYDQIGLVSPYSDTATFYAGDKPSKPTITSPSGTVSVANPTVQWSSSGQTGFILNVKNANGDVVYSVQRNNTNKAETISYSLVNQQKYTIDLKIKNVDGLYSDAAILNISVSYTPPAIPDIETVKGDSFIQIKITDPSPTGTQPVVLHHEIFKEINHSFVKIATDVQSEYKDYNISSNESVRYFVRTQGDNGTFADTDRFMEFIYFTGVWLHIVDDAENTIRHFKYDGNGRSSKWNLENITHQFKGRSRPVIEVGEMQVYSVDFSLLLRNKEDTQALEKIVYSGETVCYRDGKGRKVFGVFVDVPFNDEIRGGSSTSLSLLFLDYKEGIR
jgi:hypothetical protein